MMADQTPALCLCLIVLPEALIAHDLKGMVEDARPDLTVLCCDTPDQAMRQIADRTTVVVAFVSHSPQAFAGIPFAARVARDSGQVIYLGYDPQDHRQGTNSPPVTALPYPFALQDLLAVLPKE